MDMQSRCTQYIPFPLSPPNTPIRESHIRDLPCVRQPRTTCDLRIHIQRYQRTLAGQKNAEAESRQRVILKTPCLLSVQQTGGDFRALAEPQDDDPLTRVSGAVIVTDRRQKRFINCSHRVLGRDFRVLPSPAEPAAEGAPLAVDRENIGSAIRRERRLGEDKAVFGLEVVDEGSALGAEDAHISPAAVKTEDARKMQCWIGDYDRLV
ncbi:hypothetical protein Aspvir_001658 [Aspergillus viridinutans]|uniref:Uncharacterized protein n=1 Tax=Aspergillus viridinutans TaxID=75553 RepID=A0A9P3BTW2_ASPVI|nr:uncharacterized protein Aspvir_001658 [Aspergillus viridinutans]GIJ99525.1 hypothetical protein Aspvir_001658 [Aspergillus viridinutans]